MPFLAAGPLVKTGMNLGTVAGFGCIAATVCDFLGVEAQVTGQDLWPALRK